jgi:hypothetical protein
VGGDKFSVAWCRPVELMQVVGREGSVVVSASSIQNNAGHDLSFLLAVWVWEVFLIRYSNSCMKYDCYQLQRFHDYFLTKHYSLNGKVSEHRSSHYRTVSMDLMRTGHGSLGIRRANFGNYCYGLLSLETSKMYCLCYGSQ